MEFGGRLGLGLWERNARGQRAGICLGSGLVAGCLGYTLCPFLPLLRNSQMLCPILFPVPGASLFRKTVLFLLMIMIEDFQPIGMLESS